MAHCAGSQPLTLFQPRTNGSIEEVLEASSRAREECWQRIGSLEPLVLSHLVNPALMGGPRRGSPADDSCVCALKLPSYLSPHAAGQFAVCCTCQLAFGRRIGASAL